jgi:hypothetical protein
MINWMLKMLGKMLEIGWELKQIWSNMVKLVMKTQTET